MIFLNWRLPKSPDAYSRSPFLPLYIKSSIAIYLFPIPHPQLHIFRLTISVPFIPFPWHPVNIALFLLHRSIRQGILSPERSIFLIFLLRRKWNKQNRQHSNNIVHISLFLLPAIADVESWIFYLPTVQMVWRSGHGYAKRIRSIIPSIF